MVVYFCVLFLIVWWGFLYLSMENTSQPEVIIAEPQVTTLHLDLAGIGSRFLAFLVDAIILQGIGILVFMGNTPQIGNMAMYLPGILYILGFWIWKSATPGKMLLGIKIVGADGKAMTSSQALLRYLGYMLSGFVLGLGFIWAIFDRKKQGWHDKIADTYVVRA